MGEQGDHGTSDEEKTGKEHVSVIDDNWETAPKCSDAEQTDQKRRYPDGETPGERGPTDASLFTC